MTVGSPGKKNPDYCTCSLTIVVQLTGSYRGRPSLGVTRVDVCALFEGSGQRGDIILLNSLKESTRELHMTSQYRR